MLWWYHVTCCLLLTTEPVQPWCYSDELTDRDDQGRGRKRVFSVSGELFVKRQYFWKTLNIDLFTPSRMLRCPIASCRYPDGDYPWYTMVYHHIVHTTGPWHMVWSWRARKAWYLVFFSWYFIFFLKILIKWPPCKKGTTLLTKTHLYQSAHQ